MFVIVLSFTYKNTPWTLYMLNFHYASIIFYGIYSFHIQMCRLYTLDAFLGYAFVELKIVSDTMIYPLMRSVLSCRPCLHDSMDQTFRYQSLDLCLPNLLLQNNLLLVICVYHINYILISSQSKSDYNKWESSVRLYNPSCK